MEPPRLHRLLDGGVEDLEHPIAERVVLLLTLVDELSNAESHQPLDLGLDLEVGDQAA